MHALARPCVWSGNLVSLEVQDVISPAAGDRRRGRSADPTQSRIRYTLPQCLFCAEACFCKHVLTACSRRCAPLCWCPYSTRTVSLVAELAPRRWPTDSEAAAFGAARPTASGAPDGRALRGGRARRAAISTTPYQPLDRSAPNSILVIRVLFTKWNPAAQAYGAPVGPAYCDEECVRVRGRIITARGRRAFRRLTARAPCVSGLVSSPPPI